MTDVFRTIRERVPTAEAARRYGLTPNRAGFIPCPFHQEKTASLKIYPGTGGFYCFGCHAGGSVIDFTGRLLGLDALGAAERLNADFGLGLPLHRKPKKADAAAARHREALAEVHRAFEDWRQGTIYQLCACFQAAHALLLEPPAALTEAEALAIRWAATAEYLADVLQSGTADEQMTIFRERQVIQLRIEKILHGTRPKSGAA